MIVAAFSLFYIETVTNLFFNKFLFLFSSNLQTIVNSKKNFFFQENDQKTKKQKSYYKDNMHIDMSTLFY